MQCMCEKHGATGEAPPSGEYKPQLYATMDCLQTYTRLKFASFSAKGVPFTSSKYRRQTILGASPENTSNRANVAISLHDQIAVKKPTSGICYDFYRRHPHTYY